jgi:hypothetical protein
MVKTDRWRVESGIVVRDASEAVSTNCRLAFEVQEKVSRKLSVSIQEISKEWRSEPIADVCHPEATWKKVRRDEFCLARFTECKCGSD